MKNIELTEEHKSKLLEICKELFSELEMKWAWSDSYYGGPGDYDMLQFKTDNNEDLIHWFEFCTKLGYKIFSRKQFYYKSEEFITFMKIMCLQDKSKLKHPVDFLYEEFKKLK